MAPVITLEDITKDYVLGEQTVNILKGISLKVEKGEFVAITGPSGSGKSTLMHIIGLLDKPTTGTVSLQGLKINKLSQNKLAELRNRHIGFVFQSFNLLPRTSSSDNVALPLIYSGINKVERDRMAIKSLTEVGMSDKLNNFPSQLSGGQQQRVAIARALVNKPTLILADEPTGNLDSKTGREIIQIFRTLVREGNTIVIVTHDIELAKNTNRIVSIMDGKILSDKKK